LRSYRLDKAISGIFPSSGLAAWSRAGAFARAPTSRSCATELAGEINSAMPQHVVDRLTQGLNLQGKALNGARILLIGAAYKRNVEDVRESPAIRIIQLLHQRLARVSYHDPLVPRLQTRHLEQVLCSEDLCAQSVEAADAVVIVTDHSSVDYELILRHAKLVVDTHNVTAPYRKPSHQVVMA